MNSPVALHEFDEDEYRNRVRTLSDDDLVREGEEASFLVRRHHRHGNRYPRLRRDFMPSEL